jgi:hypothetical protein
MEYLNIASRALLCAIFAVSVLSKLRSREVRNELANTIGQLLPPLGGAWSRSAARLTVVAELAVVAMLVTVWTATVAFVAAGVLLSVFAAAIAVGLMRGRRVRCQCFGPGGPEAGVGHLARNLTLIVVACVGLLTVSPDARYSHSGLALAAAVGVLLGLIATRWEDLAFVASTSPGSARAAGAGR